jgi:signal peptidase I
MTLFFSKLYSLRKSHQIFRASYKWYKKKGDILSPTDYEVFKNQLQDLYAALQAKDRELSNNLAREVEDFCSAHFSKSAVEYLSELGIAIFIALIIAVVVRQSWFELYEIPTGSMRPTFEEKDRLTVTKTSFGINIPLMTKHLYFDPSLVQRGGVVTWSGDGIENLDTNSTFLGIFPYTKRFIKRCIAKPGDRLYFYGGKIYGVDENNRELTELLYNKWMSSIEHIPFINFEGRVSSKTDAKSNTLFFHQMNQLVGRLVVDQSGKLKGEIFNGKEWLKDTPEIQNKPHTSIQTYSDFWGIKNFAVARLLTKEQVEKLAIYSMKDLPSAPLYLELKHTPSLNPTTLQLANRSIFLSGNHSLIPLQESHLKAIMDHMYTARFVVQNGLAERYQSEENYHFPSNSPRFPDTPNGTYEFYYGKGYRVGWQGVLSELPSDHPLLKFTVSNVQRLFNFGIEMMAGFNPTSTTALFPRRFAYFKEGDLYLMGAPVLTKEDAVLKKFIVDEKEKAEKSTSTLPYVAFRDYGAPVKEGRIDLEYLKTFGYRVPEGHYLMLGDNHAMSQDSRYFGPVPEANLQGAPSLILWPPGDRWGVPRQNPYPFINLPRLIVWGVVLMIGGVWYWIYRRKWAHVKF